VSRADRFVGAMVVLATSLHFLASVMEDLAKGTALDAVFAACNVITGTLAVRSIWRDRL